MMNLFRRKVTKEQMLASIAMSRSIMSAAPGSKGILQMYDILTRIEAAYANGREPSGFEIKGFLGEMISALENLGPKV